MTIDAQEYLQEWEKINNPFYPNEMKWDRLTVNKFLCDYKRQLPIASHAVLSEVRALLDMLNGEDVIIMQSTALRQGEFEELLRKVSEHFR